MNKKPVIISIILLIFVSGFYFGSYFYKHNSVVVKDQESSISNSTMTTLHNEGKYPVPDTAPAPTVKLFLEKDAKAGYNLHVETTNFIFTPENVNKENVMGEGHAHIFINGEKLGRLYGNWYHIKSLPQGNATVTVNLTANGHETYVVHGEEIADTIVVEVPLSPQPTMHKN